MMIGGINEEDYDDDDVGKLLKIDIQFIVEKLSTISPPTNLIRDKMMT